MWKHVDKEAVVKPVHVGVREHVAEVADQHVGGVGLPNAEDSEVKSRIPARNKRWWDTNSVSSVLSLATPQSTKAGLFWID